MTNERSTVFSVTFNSKATHRGEVVEGHNTFYFSVAAWGQAAPPEEPRPMLVSVYTASTPCIVDFRLCTWLVN